MTLDEIIDEARESAGDAPMWLDATAPPRLLIYLTNAERLIRNAYKEGFDAGYHAEPDK